MGWAVIEHAIGTDDNPRPHIVSYTRSGGAALGTNQIAELTAILVALRTYSARSPKRAKHLIIETDSLYSINASTEWLKNWKRNGWKNSKKQAVVNREIIQAIDEEIENREQTGGTIKFVKVKGHTGEFFNEAADTEAVKQSEYWKTQIGTENETDYSKVPAEAVPAIKARNASEEEDELTLF